MLQDEAVLTPIEAPRESSVESADHLDLGWAR
jgi:hypothetical protein